MKASIVKGNLILEIPIQTPTASASGKTLVIATTRGNKTLDLTVPGPDGQPRNVTVGLNAYIKP